MIAVIRVIFLLTVILRAAVLGSDLMGSVTNPSKNLDSIKSVYLEHVETFGANENEFMINHGMRIRKFNRTTPVFLADWTLKQPYDDDLEVTFELYCGPNYPKIFSKKMNKTCSATMTEEFKRNTFGFLESSNAPLGKVCPIPIGRYFIKDYYPDFSKAEYIKFSKSLILSDKAKVRMTTRRNSKVLFQADVYFRVKTELSD